MSACETVSALTLLISQTGLSIKDEDFVSFYLLMSDVLKRDIDN